jgi:branched-chain amino acid transport system substrate-binding protein
LRYFRERGLKKIAYIVATDAGGQAAEKAFLGAMDLPENKSLQIVTRQYFAMSDLNTTAQMARIKASNPDALLAWSTGSAAGTLFRSAHDAGIDLPTVTSPSNLNAAFFKQYGSLLPTNLYFAAVPYYATDAPTTQATKAALATMTSSLAAVGAKPDMIEISAWDPGLLVIDALRKLGADASAAKLRAYLVNLKGWTGTNGPYDFRADPQRGVGESNIVMVRWDAQRDAGVAVSRLGGAPLRGR